MARGRPRKNAKRKSETLDNNLGGNRKEPQVKKQYDTSNDHEVERRIAATRAIRDVEIEHLLTGLRLLRSNFNKEQMQTPALQFFKETLPNLSVVRNEKGQFEVRWKDKDGHLSISHADDSNIHASFLHLMSIAYPACTSAMPALGGFEFSSKSVKTSLVGAANLQIPDLVLEEPSETQMLGLQDAFQTPGVSTQRLSVGMTPKTRRLPKNGEMLLSIHGSPLGVYKEDKMGAIHESEEG
ncbi:PREDICTED: uncharacterized protein LOC104604165 [Nelumbo nucifera]|uniref:Uncharacterized protein LOC104604165 n=2 Tax=Nelumbo nucifera TaxID=4432 RepID=A0A1U8AL38_NELNU|nr:PREDICTED: uncharacterized protein LOC104604165 [Nelumbo nucifera]DAD29148.1 TPA_asm: hypothetical protein HUJ06_030616 [Nelumbo nucifera]